jgi:hypothetical protein
MKTVKNIKPFNEAELPFDWVILFFRIAVSLQLIIVHGLKKNRDWEQILRNLFPIPMTFLRI